MSFFGIPRGRNKAAATVRIRVISLTVTNNAELSLNSGTPTTVTFRDTTWLELFSSLPATVNSIDIFESTGFTFRMATGAPSSETDLMLITPGGNGFIPVKINAGQRVSVRPITNPDVDTEVVINFFD